MLAEAPADAPWRTVCRRLWRGLVAARRRFERQALASVTGMDAGERSSMIRGMVERLATRLKNEGGDAEQWLRLVRAYMVLGERDKAARCPTREAVATTPSVRSNSPEEFGPMA